MSIYLIVNGTVQAVSDVPANPPEGALVVRERQDLVAAKALTVAELVKLSENLELDAPKGKACTRPALINLIWPVMCQLQTPAPKAGGKTNRGGAGEVTPTKPGEVAPDTRIGQILAALRQPDGVAIKDLATQLGWQRHSVHGVLSAVIRKKLGLAVTSAKGEDGVRRYRLA